PHEQPPTQRVSGQRYLRDASRSTGCQEDESASDAHGGHRRGLKRLFAGPLWRHPDFLLLWSGQTISQAGSQVSQLAIPTVAILVLHASPFEVGLLTALEFLAFPVLGLVAGVYADRLK